MDNPVFHASLAIFMMMILGCVLRHFRWLAPEADRTLMCLSVNLLYPCLIFSKILKTDLSGYFATLWIFPACGFGIVAVSLFFCWLFTRLPVGVTGLHDAKQRRTFIGCVSVFNYGFLPIPLVMQLYPGNNELLTLLFVFNLGVEFALWTLAVPQIAGGLERGWWKKLFRVPLCAILLAVLANYLGAVKYLPAAAAHSLDLLGMAQIPISLMMIGAIIYDELMQNIRAMRKRDTTKIILGTFLLRAMILPAMMIWLATFFPQYPWLQTIIVIQAGMPCATMPIVFARMYGGEPSVAVISSLSSNFLALGTVVFWFSFGMWVIGA